VPDAGNIGGVGPAGRPGRPGGPGRAGRRGRGEFARELSRQRETLRSAEAPELDRVRAAVESQERLTATGARLLRRYSALERDAALYEVTAGERTYHVVLGRDGSLTVFEA